MNENQLDLSLFHDFPPQLSEHTVPKLRMTDHGELVMNPAMKKCVGTRRDFLGKLSQDGTMLLLLEAENGNVHFTEKTCIAKHRSLQAELVHLGFSLPVNYRIEYREEQHAWLGICEELVLPSPTLKPTKTRRRRHT